MSQTTIQPAAVLGFTPPEPLRKYAQVAVWAETPQAFEEFCAILVDAGHTLDPRTNYYSYTGEPYTVVWWHEGAVSCSCHGPKGYAPGAKEA